MPSPTSVTDEFNVGNQNLTIESDGKTYTGTELVEKAKRKMDRILNARKYIERLLVDLSNTWKFILIGLPFSMVFALVWIVLMRFAAGWMIWLGILSMLALLIASESDKN